MCGVYICVCGDLWVHCECVMCMWISYIVVSIYYNCCIWHILTPDNSVNLQHGTTYVKRFMEDGNSLEEMVRFFGVSWIQLYSLASLLKYMYLWSFIVAVLLLGELELFSSDPERDTNRGLFTPVHLYIYVLYETYNLVHVQVQIHTQSGVHALLTSTA